MKKLTLTLLLALVSLSAWADTSGSVLNQFTPPASDTSVDFLRQVFGEIIGLITSGGKAASAPNDSVLGSMMAIFNTAVLFIGMIFVGYTTLKGTIASAHDGETLGKRMSSIWVPLRTVGGTLFLLPLGSGYSLVQIGILWIGIQGVGAADKIWNAAIEQMSRDNMIARPIIPDSRPLAANILKFEVCAGAMNKQYAESGSSTRIVPVATQTSMSNWGEFTANAAEGNLNMVKNYANATYTVTNYNWNANDNRYLNKNVCGGVSWKQSYEASEGNSNLKTLKAPLMAAHTAALQAMIAELQPVADQIVQGQKPAAGAIDKAAGNYEKTLQAAAKNVVSQSTDRARSDFLSAAKDGGWLYAGTWYNHIARMNDAVQSTLNGLPAADPIGITDKESQDVLQNYKDTMAVVDEYAKNRSESVKQVYYHDTDVKAPQANESMYRYAIKLISSAFMGGINQMTQEIGNSNLNPMSQMKAFGDVLVVTGESCLAVMTAAVAGADSKLMSGTVGVFASVAAALQFLSGFVTTLVMALLCFGVMLSTYLPMIPFITWISAVVNWFVLVLESVIAGPLFAVAHVHPDGDEAVGKAGPGWMMLLSLILRPSLMLFGLIGAMLLTQPVAGVINTAFMSVVAGVQADSMTGIASFLAFVAIYVLMMTTVVHLVFSLIHFIPDNILRWLGHAAGGLAGAEQTGERIQGSLAAGAKEMKAGVMASMGRKKKKKGEDEKDKKE